LAVPDDNQWVNLSPYEKDRIIKEDFGKTEMGRDLLAQDYMLKQITASLIYPQDNLGQKFWDEVYSKAQQQFGTTNIPVNTFNKVWIVPDDALICEKGNTAYVVKNHLKVMLEEDYLSLAKHTGIQSKEANKTHAIASQVVREIVLPALEKEVTEGKNFAPLRQVFSGMLLAAWYKRALKESLLGKIYMNKSRIKGVDQDPRNNEIIYQQYLRAFKKGVFNFIKEDVDKYSNETIPRKYFSGGFRNIYRKKRSDGRDILETEPELTGDQMAGASIDIDNAEIAEVSVGSTSSQRKAVKDREITDEDRKKFEDDWEKAAKDGERAAWDTKVAGALAPSIRSTISNPLDLIKRRFLTAALNELGARFKRIKGLENRDFRFHVVPADSLFGRMEKSAAFTFPGDIFFDERYLERVTDDEVLAVIAHEIAHNIYEDHLMGPLMEALIAAHPENRVLADLYENHTEISCDELAVELLIMLGVDPMAMVTGLEKAVAFSRGIPEYIPLADETEIRLQVLRDYISRRESHQLDKLNNFYATVHIPGGITALGFRVNTEMTNKEERAQDILHISELIGELINTIAEAPRSTVPFLKYFIDHFNDKLNPAKQGAYSPGRVKRDRRTALSLTLDIAFLERLIEFNRYYERIGELIDLKESLEELLDTKVLGEEVRVGPIRKVNKGQYTYPSETDFLMKELPYDLYILTLLADEEGVPIEPKIPKVPKSSNRTRWFIGPIALLYMLTGMDPQWRVQHHVQNLLNISFGKAYRKTSTTDEANVQPGRNPDAFSSAPEGMRIAAYFVQRTVTDQKWARSIGLLNHAVLVNGQPKAVSPEDVGYYKRELNGINTDPNSPLYHTPLTNGEKNGVEGGVVALENALREAQIAKHMTPTVTITGDVGEIIWGEFLDRSVAVLQAPPLNLLPSRAWEGLVSDGPVTFSIGGKNVTVSRENIEAFKAKFPRVNPSVRIGALSEQEQEVVHVAVGVFQREHFLPVTGILDPVTLGIEQEFAREAIFQAEGGNKSIKPGANVRTGLGIHAQTPTPNLGPKANADKSQLGGIDLNAADLAMVIKRDGRGVPLPWAQQDLAQFSNIEGLDAHILSIKPASQSPLLSQLQISK